MESQRQKILTRVAMHLHAIGSANDAEDHNFLEDATRMRSEACTALNAVLAEHQFLEDLLPSLRSELETGTILWVGWSLLLERIESLLSSSKD
jgi:gamma-glutamyl phosphate reductase